MVKIPVTGLANIGVVKDTPDHLLPPNAWTDALNMRFDNKRVSRFRGMDAVMGTPTVAPSFVMNVETPSGIFWLYAEADGAGSKVYGFNSGTHTDVSKSGDYTVANFRDWNGTTFHGTPIINPVSDDPQYWSTISLSQALQDLSNWPANTTVKKIRAYKNFLVGLYPTVSGTPFPHRVIWSHRADAGNLPDSWDDTDETKDAGKAELSDINAGFIREGLPLRDMFAIYKRDSTWLMRFKGGTDVMEFATILSTSGIVSERGVCSVTLPQQKTDVHFVMTGNDLGIFDGQGFESVVDEKDREFLVNDIDATNILNSYCFDNPTKHEATFVYPSSGESIPNMAAVWDYSKNTITFRDFIGVHAQTGAVESSGIGTWAQQMNTWAASGGAKWQEGSPRKVVVADRAGSALLQLDSGDTLNGTEYSSFVERTGLALIGVDRQGQPMVDFERRKLVNRLWPKIRGGRVRITIGVSEEIDEAPNYVTADNKNTAIFDPSNGDKFVDVVNDGRLIAVKFEGVDGDYWELESYAINVEPLGEH